MQALLDAQSVFTTHSGRQPSYGLPICSGRQLQEPAPFCSLQIAFAPQGEGTQGVGLSLGNDWAVKKIKSSISRCYSCLTFYGIGKMYFALTLSETLSKWVTRIAREAYAVWCVADNSALSIGSTGSWAWVTAFLTHTS